MDNRLDHICEYCDVEYVVESDSEDVITFCPYCGTGISFENTFYDEYE